MLCRNPVQIVSDVGRKFDSAAVRDFASHRKITWKITTAYNRTVNAKVQQMVGKLNRSIQNVAPKDAGRDCDECLSTILGGHRRVPGIESQLLFKVLWRRCSSYQNFREAKIYPLMKTASGPLRLRNINVKIIQCSENYFWPGFDCDREIFHRNSLLEAAELHINDFFADHIDHFVSLDFGTVFSNK